MNAKPLKSGWKMVKFGDIAQNVAVRVDPAEAKTEVYVGLEHLDPNSLHLHQWGHPSDVTGQKLAFKKGDVIFGRRRAYQRKLAVAEFDGICSAHAMVVRAKPKMIMPEFLPFFLQSDTFMERAIQISVGSLSPTINWKTLQVQQFPLPPLDEQKRNAEILWAADDAVEARKILIERLNETRIGLGNSVWGKDHVVHREKLGSLCLKIQDGTHFSPQSSSGTRRYMTSKNIRDGYLELSDCGWITEEEHRNIYRKADVRSGDVVITKDGANTGNAAFFNLEEEVSLLSSVAFIRVNPEKLNAKFLLAFLRSPRGNWKIIREMKGTAITRITLTQIREFRVPVIPIKEQNEFAKKFEKIDSIIQIAEKDLCDITTTKYALLNQFFEGTAHV
ncbi:MAG: restriction endonuclease subunit S [Chlorobiales bacterium]|nr:restriction endonuclease subunit S [Chlorobiales bacterium]